MPVPMSAEVIDAEVGMHFDAELLTTSGTDGDRDALRILLGAREDMTTTITGQSNRLRALLLGGDGTDRKVARAALTEVILASLARRREPRGGTRQQCVRHVEIQRLALSLFAAGLELRTNTMQLQAIVDDLVPELTARRGIGPIRAAQAIVNLSDASMVPRQRGAPPRRQSTAPPQADSRPQSFPLRATAKQGLVAWVGA